MGLFDKKKKKQLYEGQLYLIQINLENNYRNEVIEMAREVYGNLKRDYDSGSINVDMYTDYLRKVNDYVKKADEKMFPIEKHV